MKSKSLIPVVSLLMSASVAIFTQAQVLADDSLLIAGTDPSIPKPASAAAPGKAKGTASGAAAGGASAAATGAASAAAAGGASAAATGGASGAAANLEPGQKGLFSRHNLAKAATMPEKIPCLRWADDTVKPKAILFCIHGLGLHKGCYEDFGKAMAKKGIITYAIDVRGFGDWVQKGVNDTIDFPGTISDIKRALTQIRSNNPGLPVIVLGESMGGGIGIHATAEMPELIDGLVSSVPAGERYGATEEKIKVGMHAVLGMKKQMDVGTGVIKQATQKEELREKWGNDPLCRKDLSPSELMAFQGFMNKNFDEAEQIKSKPVLVIQGAEDKLVIPASTLKLYNSIASYNKTKVLSKNAEHLIFEEGQYNPEDLNFVTNWIDRKIIAKDDSKSGTTVATASTSTGTAPGATKDMTNAQSEGGNSSNSNSSNSNSSNSSNSNGSGGANTATSAPTIHIKPATPASAPAKPDDTVSTAAAKKDNAAGPAISYWIELYRGGKVYRCNNKLAFQSGDAIRFHIIPKSDGYAYLLMKQGTSGKHAILFPSATTGSKNYLKAGTDYPVPAKDWLSFDNTPGIEKVSLLFSRTKVLSDEVLNAPAQLAYISNDKSGAKDLVPTRMQLSWDDPTPVILPDQIAPSARGARQEVTSTENGSMVNVSFNDPSGLLAVDVALAHE